jgi:Bacillus haemolytic enterotoxin (HBL)
MSALGTIDQAVAQITAVQVPSSPAVPTLPADLESLRTVALTWPSAVRGQVTSHVTACAGQAAAYADTTGPQLQASAAEQNTPQFVALLQATQSAVVSLQGQATTVTAAVNTFRSGLLDAAGRLTADAQTAASALQGEQAEIVSLQQEMNALNAKIDEDREYEQLGWLLGPLGAIIAREIQADQQQIATLSADVDALNGIAGALNALVPANGMVIAGLTALTNGLAVVGGDLANVLQAVGSAGSVDPTWAQAELQRLAEDWADVGSAATALGS